MKVRYVGPRAEGVDVPCVKDGYQTFIHVEPGQEIEVEDDLGRGLVAQETWEPRDPAAEKVAAEEHAALDERIARRNAGYTLSGPVADEVIAADARKPKTGGSPKVREGVVEEAPAVTGG